MESVDSSKNQDRISVVIVSYNTRELLADCLTSLREFEPKSQVIVVDNSSRDGSEAMVRERFPEVTVIQSGRNAGFAGANNLGIAKARGDFVVLLNSDTRLMDPALSSAVKWLDQHPNVGATSPKLLGPDDLPQSCIYAWPRVGALWREALKLPPRPVKSHHDGWLAGTCLILRKAALGDVGGGLDESYWMYWEDADLSQQLVNHGWGVIPYEGATIRHYGGASGGGDDASRRADLHAWYLYGKHRWFRKNRGLLAAAAVWILDALDVPRKVLRSIFRPGRTAERAHAGVQARTLLNALTGRTPPVPGTKAKAG
ncbi:glycosyltransferase [bacterium]|nr:glycosyltransferase [bacterium]